MAAARANLSEEVAQIAQCEEVVRDLMESDDCWPFLAPVNRREVTHPPYQLQTISLTFLPASNLKISILPSLRKLLTPSGPTM